MVDSKRARSGGRRRGGGETRTPLDTFLQRLEQLGADEAMRADVAARWDDFDAEWTPGARDAFVRQNDTELREAIASVVREYDHATTSADDAAARQRARHRELTYAEALGRMGQSVPALIAWVGDDAVRAEVVSELEQRPDGANRKTLVVALEPMLGTA